MEIHNCNEVNELDTQAVNLVIARLLGKIIEQYPPHQWTKTEEAFPHPYQFNKVSYDYSGEVEPMTLETFQDLVNKLGNDHWYSSKFEELLHNIYINRWVPTFTSNFGKHWQCYHDLLFDAYNDWKYTHFELYDEDGNELDEELENNLNECFEDFIHQTSPELYVKKMMKFWWR